MNFKRFEDIIIWQKSKELAKIIYLKFEDSKDFGFKNQIQRASVSIMNNIAEGFERKSNKEFTYFLYVSKGSCGELRSMLHLAFELDKISKEDFELLFSLSEEISRMLAALINTINQKD